MLALCGVVLTALFYGVEASPAEKRAAFNFPPTPRSPIYPLDIVDKLQLNTAVPNMITWMEKKAQNGQTNCTLENAAIRQEWSDLTIDQRQEYINAVLCLQKQPAKAGSKAPGALSRYDDFVATHMTQAMMLHDPQHLLGAHRYFIWLYEKALREECGYTGYQPYMNYDRYAQDPVNSPMFNGNATSMGGQGAPSTYPGVPQPFPKPYNFIPPGGGGGCVTEGPFKDMVISLGPLSTVVENVPKNPRPDGLGSNPRCLRRDVNRNSALGATANYTLNLIMNNTEIDDFYNRYLGSPQLKGDEHPWGLHNAGHYMIGGDPGGDFFASPGDPAFWFHHGMLDRVWFIWQMLDPDNRLNLIPGMDDPQVNISSLIVDLQWTGPPIPLTELNDQLGGANGQFCYIYV